MFIDTHCHLNMMVQKERDQPLNATQIEELSCVVEAAQKVEVSTLINVGTSLAETRNSLALARRYDGVFATAGIHPCDVESKWQQQLVDLTALVRKHRHDLVAIGETGLDYYHKPFDVQVQAALFEGHIELALQSDLPLVVHVREAGDDALKIIEKYKNEARGVMHCFSLDLAAAQLLAEWGWYIGIDGPVTYPKNDWLRGVVATVSLEQILLETDAPFLPPQSRRGKQNSPVYIPEIAQEIARVRGCSIDDVGMITSANARRLFGLGGD